MSEAKPVQVHGPYRPPFLSQKPPATAVVEGDKKEEGPTDYGPGSPLAELLGIRGLPVGHVTSFDRRFR